MFPSLEQFVGDLSLRVQQRAAQIARVGRQKFALELTDAHAADVLIYGVSRSSMRFASLIGHSDVGDDEIAAFIAGMRAQHPRLFERPTANEYVNALRERGVADPSSYVRGRDDDEIRRAYFQLPRRQAANPSGSKAA